MGVLIFVVFPVVIAWLVHTGCVGEVLALILFSFYGKDKLEHRIEIFLVVSTLTIFVLSILRTSLPLVWLSVIVWRIALEFYD